MILWRDPLSFLAVAVVPALAAFLWWGAGRRRAALARFVAAGLQPAVAPDVDPRRRRTRAGLVTAAVALVVVALAGPMWGFHWEEVKREGVDVIVAIDTSRSMLSTDVKPNRLARAKLAVQDLLGRLRGDRIGLVAFAGTAFVQCPLTLDRGAFAQSLEAVDVGLIPRGGTSLTAAIDAGLEAFEGRQGKNQALVLITDGEKTEGGDPKDAVGRAKERGVRVYTVGIGTAEGELIPAAGGGFVKDRSGQVVKSRLDEATLQEVATDTGGVYLHAAGPSMGLTELYDDYIAKMDNRELASTLEKRFEQRFQWPLAAAVALLLAEALVGERRRERRRALAWRPGRATAVVAALVLGATSIGWLDRWAAARAGNRLYVDGKYDDAATKYNEALVDDPDSPLLHFNLGAATYKQRKYEDALKAFQQVPVRDDDPARTARTAYDAGNAAYQLGTTVQGSEPQKALEHWAQALAFYRRALGAAPEDVDAKFNYEFVQQKIADLRKKLEEQKQQQDQQQQQKQPDQDGQKPDRQQGQNGEQPPDDQQQPEQQQAGQGEQPPKPPEDRQQAQGAQPRPDAQQGEPKDQQAGGEMSPQEAAALLDAQRAGEVRPDEIVKRVQRAGVAEAVKDW